MATRSTPRGDRVLSAVDPEATARAYVDMWNDREYAAIPQLVADTFVMYDPAAPAKGVAGPKGEVHGRDGLRQFMEVISTAFPDFEITVLDMVSGEDIVMYEVRLTMTHDGPLGGLPPTGREVQIRGVSILHLDAGIIREHRFHTNMNEVAPQLGLTFPQLLGQLPKLLIGKVRLSIS
ncbi:ester cyclase [Haloarcula pelagica]|uniref:ester cyclase n=1 Tax=Haloarcula pelagica TaxID=3033389 RepID=UPI0024C335A8|nr:ester cyclase [Halomicroarcula sp. YJ-61-S]